MTTIEIEEIYRLGCKIYREEKDQKEVIKKAVIEMNKSYGRSKDSIRYYLKAIVSMLNGKNEFKRKISNKALKYFFEQIIIDFKGQKNVIENAFKATEFYMEYQINPIKNIIDDAKKNYNSMKFINE